MSKGEEVCIIEYKLFQDEIEEHQKQMEEDKKKYEAAIDKKANEIKEQVKIENKIVGNAVINH